MKKIIAWYLQGDEVERAYRLVEIVVYLAGVFGFGLLLAGY